MSVTGRTQVGSGERGWSWGELLCVAWSPAVPVWTLAFRILWWDCRVLTGSFLFTACVCGMISRIGIYEGLEFLRARSGPGHGVTHSREAVLEHER